MVIAIIPARLGSSRLKNKPLVMLANFPVVAWTASRALRSDLIDKVIVATDSPLVEEAILESASRWELLRSPRLSVMMTPSELPSGSDRVAWVARELVQQGAATSQDLFLNLQGDEPCMPSFVLDHLIKGMPTWASVGTVAGVFQSQEEFESPHHVKVMVNQMGEACYFSRNMIPAGPKTDAMKIASRHAGIYLYRFPVLQQMAQLPPGNWEQLENLEQLRLFQQGIRYYVWQGEFRHHEVNTPQDLEVVEKLLAAELAGLKENHGPKH